MLQQMRLQGLTYQMYVCLSFLYIASKSLVIIIRQREVKTPTVTTRPYRLSCQSEDELNV